MLILRDETEDDFNLGGDIIARRSVQLPARRADDSRWVPSGKESILKLTCLQSKGYCWEQIQAAWEDADGIMAPLIGNIAMVYETIGDAIRTAQTKKYLVTRNGMVIKINEEAEEDPTEVGLTTHHLFTNPEVRVALVKIYGEPTTPEEIDRLHKEMAKIRRWMPTYEISEEHHRFIHGLVKTKKHKSGWKFKGFSEI